MSFYDFTLPRLGGGSIELSEYRGRPMLIVNTASECGFTPQYAGLQRLWDEFRDRGLVVIGVPSNDFGGQEPGSEAEIGAFCQKNYGVSFPVAGKTQVKGHDAHPLFRQLAKSGGVFSKPRWNFYKYLVSRDGSLDTWFSSMSSPQSGRVRTAISKNLGQDL